MVATLVIVFIPPSIHEVNFYLLGEILLPFCLNYTKQEREREREIGLIKEQIGQVSFIRKRLGWKT